MTRLFAAALLFALATVTPADDKKMKDAIVDIPNDKADKIETNDGVAMKPITVSSEDDLKKVIPDEASWKRIAKLVDFKVQKLLVFAWKGSGGDKLEYMVLERFPEIIKFAVAPGKTDDLRSHVRLFAVRNNVTWSVK